MISPHSLTGKSVALVGPAPSLGDQSAQVESCDIIIRCNYRWNGNDILDGYGERTDAAFYSIAGSKSVIEFPSILDGLPWVILKDGAPDFAHPNIVRAMDPFPMANQLPILLNFVEPFEPSEIHIFGADFYTSGYERATQVSYLSGYDPSQYWKDLQLHDQSVQHVWMKTFQERTGLVKGDSRMVDLLSYST